MTDEFDPLHEEERLKNEEERLMAENDFLKMKLMLEHGADFSTSGKDDLPADIENEFLNHIMAFEKQFAEQKKIKIYDKIERPQHFKPVAKIADNDMEEAYQALLNHLNRYGIDLDVCSPNITTRELYRFVTEELFDYETDDMDLPGWTTNFIYDEFHPDPVYDNTRAAVDDCIKQILRKEPFEWMHHFQTEGLRLNQHTQLSDEAFKTLVNRFQDAYEDIELHAVEDVVCTIQDAVCHITGTYRLSARTNQEVIPMNGKWRVQMQLKEDFGYWYITDVEIEGIAF
ncbi:MAG: hypothetical protein ICV53_12060 [Flavisolibacter sp.]|nr:hypothetical protein [Flavisolibacter sp.]